MLGRIRLLMRASILQIVVVPLLLALGVASTGATVIVMRPTLAEFMAEADAVCNRDDTELGNLQIGTSMASMSVFGTKLAGSTTGTISEIRSLARPPGADPDNLLDEMGRAAAFGRAMSKAATERRFPDAAKAGAQMSLAFKRADDFARDLGLKECGRTASRTAATGTQGAPGILKQGFINDVNAQCKAAFDRVPSSEPASLPELASYMASVVDEGTKLNARLREIAPPPAEKAAVESVLKSFETVVTSAGQLRDAARSVALSDFEARLLKFFEDSEEANIKADQYGFRECGSG